MNHVNHVNGGSDEPSRQEVVIQLTPPVDGPYVIARVVDQLVRRGWLRIDSRQCLHLTDSGETARVRLGWRR